MAESRIAGAHRGPEALEAFSAAYLDAWNSHDPDRLLALMAPDVVYDDSAWPTTMRGHDDVRRFLEHAWRACPDMRFELLEGPYTRGEDKAAFWWRGTGTLTGDVDPPGFAPTGKRFETDGVDFHEYRDGLISRLRIVFDVADMSQQLGLLPPRGSRGERVVVMLQRLGARFGRRR
jgi:steroid delta-isomerase-like uncharacterized protein